MIQSPSAHSPRDQSPLDQLSKVQASSSPESKCRESKCPGVLSSRVQTMCLESSFSGMSAKIIV